jgi:hypothetical protein
MQHWLLTVAALLARRTGCAGLPLFDPQVQANALGQTRRWLPSRHAA